MPAKPREIQSRIKAVGNIERITRTMQMIATARFQSMQKRATRSRAYTDKITELVGELASALAAGGEIEHPLLSPPDPPVNKRLVLVMTSSRGLCGAYNANVLRTARQFLREHEQEEMGVEVVGKKALGYFQFNGIPVSEFHDQFGDQPAYEPVERLADRYIREFTAGAYDGIHICYTAFHSMSQQTPRVTRLLPLENPADQTEAGQSGGGAASYDFMPEPESLLAEILPTAVKTQLFQCFNEAVVSEHLARMVAMQAATDAAGQMQRTLKRQFNRARQAQITKELSEIIGGAAALE